MGGPNTMSELHRTITVALDRTGIVYGQREDRDDVYLLERDGVLLMVGPLAVDGVPAAVSIFAIVLENVECTRELTVDLLARNGKTLPAWATHDQPDGTVTVTLSYKMNAEQLDVGLVERTVNWVLDKATAEVDALQATYGGKRKVVAEESPEPTAMPTGPITCSGRYPGYEPAQAMAAFLSAPSQRVRPSHREVRDSFWGYNGNGYEFYVGCFAEHEGTPVIVVTGFCDQTPECLEAAATFLLLQRRAMEESAHSTEDLGENGLAEAVASDALRQLRLSEIGSMPESVRGRDGQQHPNVDYPDASRREHGSYWQRSRNMFSKFREGREKRHEEQAKQRQEREKQRLEEERTKWRTVPIERHHRVDPPPSFEELADLAIQRAGSGVDFDHDAVVAYLYNFWFTLTTGVLERYPLISNVVHGLWVIPQRDDFERRMLWDYFTMQGPTGVGIHNFLAKDIQSDEIIGIVAGRRIRRGDLCDVDETSRFADEDVEEVYRLSTK